MQVGLGDSLEHIRERVSGRYTFDEPRLSALIAGLRSGVRHPPATFGRYYDLVERIVEDDRASAEALLDEISASRPVTQALRVLPLDHAELRPAAALYRRRMDTDPTTRFTFLDPPADRVAPFRNRFDEAMALFDTTIPALSGEVRGLLSEVVLATGPKTDAYVFDGGSSYMLWGALFLNVAFHDTLVAMAEVIAHESAHTLLFGFTVDEPLVFNPDDELFPSPLRADLRPMDGIFHATFVSARMHWVMTRLAASGALSAEEQEAARTAAASDAVNFRAGHEVVARHGDLSATGAALMRGAAEAMADPA